MTGKASALQYATYRQLDHWCRLGLLPGARSSGSGFPRDFTGALDHVRACALLSSKGNPFNAADVERLARDGALVVHRKTGTITYRMGAP